MFVDVVSVFPLGAVYAHLSGTAGGADEAGSARVLKVRYSSLLYTASYVS
jgi:hypothetical protein